MQTLIEQYSESWRNLRRISGCEVSNSLKFKSLIELLSTNNENALVSESDENQVTSHARLVDFIMNECNLTKFGLQRGDRVGVAIPLGPHLIVSILATTTYCACAPINPNGKEEEIRNELQILGVKCVIVIDDQSSEHIQKAAKFLDIRLLLLKPSTTECGLFTLNDPTSLALKEPLQEYSGPKDVVLVLQTSGTTGTKKVVPILLQDLCVGTVCIASSMGLTKNDICINLMPLFHVGGIIRNIFAPLLSGGSILCMSAIDPKQFWKLIKSKGCTWYYAAPTIHMSIIEEAKRLDDTKSSIRVIANAAGGLLPSIANELKSIFGAVILPCYGMTECMPISCPPYNYNLEKPGSSGIPIGPEVSIMDDNDNVLPTGVTGNIMIRGAPLMHGYENGTQETFNKEGWFSTGDMGNLDEDGFLFVTGRSKEVINRGGEIISPFEIEDVLVTHPSIKEVVAFSVPHTKLQETIGVAIVTRSGFSRVRLQTLHRYIEEKLHPSKWPQCIVFMNELVKTNTGKTQRVGLAARMKLPKINDQLPEYQRLFEAECPPAGSSLITPIVSFPVEIAVSKIDQLVSTLSKIIKCSTVVKNDKIICFVKTQESQKTVQLEINELLHQNNFAEYLIPDSIIVIDGNEELPTNPSDIVKLKDIEVKSQIGKEIIEIMASLIPMDINHLNFSDDFFAIGGDSIKAGQLVSEIRKKMQVTITATSIFSLRTVDNISTHVEQLLNKKGNDISSQPSSQPSSQVVNNTIPKSPIQSNDQTGFTAMLVQIFPFAFLMPLRRAGSWILFLNALVWTNFFIPSNFYAHRMLSLVLALIICKVVRNIALPIFFILSKWIIVYKFRPGKYPLWSSYYLRWWIIDQLQRLTGLGIFRYFDWTIRLYYRLLGAHIGWNVRINTSTILGEYDLITIESNTVIDSKCIVRAFTADSGSMILEEIKIGQNVHVADRVVIPPGSTIPNDVAFAATSSSYEPIQTNSQQPIPDFKPNWVTILVFGVPILSIIWAISLIPVFFILKTMADASWHKSINSWTDAVEWFLVGYRVIIYISLRSIYSIVTPLISLILGIIVKRCVIGKFKAGPVADTQWNRLRYWIVPHLVGEGRFFGLSSLFGSHYEIISIIYRLLGAKIGKRVYWPGSGIPIVEFDLLEVGDDVVFGSRTNIKCTANGVSAPVTFLKGSNIADRCYIMPGVVVGEGAILGSGTYAPAHSTFLAKSIWVGCNNGKPLCLNKGVHTSPTNIPPSPFGQAFYLGNAPYVVFPLPMIVSINLLWLIFVASFKALPVIGALYLGHRFYFHHQPVNEYFFLFAFAVLFIAVQLIFSIVAILIDILAKWLILGRRKPGTYNWNESSYCQRWQLYLTVQNISMKNDSGIYKLLQGSVYLVWYFRALGAKIGRNVCLYPTGADPMMTEPDLVTIEDNSSINNASVIGHLNSRGKFKLNNLSIGMNCTLRSNSRLLSGSEMKESARLLEHTLVLEGETVPAFTTWQGWPANKIN